MKRILALGATLAITLSLTACAHGVQDDTLAASAEPEKQAEAKAHAQPTTPARIAKLGKAALPAAAKVVVAAAKVVVPAVAAAPAVAGAEAPEEKCACAGHCDGAEADAESDAVESVALGSSLSRGPERAPVTVVVFSDFQCPFCAKAESTIRDLEAAYPGKVRYVFKNQPLPFHESAPLAARAALAAGQQGKFWEYHDALFAHQSALDRASLERYAEDLGLDLRRFRAAIDAPELEAALQADVAEAHRLDVTGTPTFFVNGRRIKGAQPIAVFRGRVDEALARR